MSDHFPPPSPAGDRVRDTLTALRVDADRVGLSDPAGVRRRGQRRGRNQAVAGALAVVALVAGAAGLFRGLDGDARRTAPPATSATPTAEATMSLAAKPFLRTTDLTGLGRYAGLGTLLEKPSAPDLDPPAGVCQVRPTQWGAAELAAAGYYQDGTTVGIVEVVLRFDTAGQARAALDRPEADLGACPEPARSEGTLEVRPATIVTGVEGGVQMARRFTPSVASESSYYEVAAARTSNVVVVLQWAADDAPSDDPNGWAWSTATLAAALDRATG